MVPRGALQFDAEPGIDGADHRLVEPVDIVAELTKRLVKIEVQEGAQVAKGDVLFILDDADLVAEITEIDAKLKLAQANESRTGTLLPEKAISRQAYDLATAEFDIFKAQKDTKQVELSKTRILAPFAGKTGIRHVSEGALVKPETVLMTLQDPAWGAVQVAGNPIKMSDTPEPEAGLPPRLGQHTDSVLGDWLHMNAQQLDALHASEVI